MLVCHDSFVKSDEHKFYILNDEQRVQNDVWFTNMFNCKTGTVFSIYKVVILVVF